MKDIVRLVNDEGEITFSHRFAPLEPVDDNGNYRLLEDFEMRWTVENRQYRLRAPKGLITDIASVPRIVWTLSGILPDGLQRNAAIIHDIGYMWRSGKTNTTRFPVNWFEKRQPDGSWQNVTGAEWTKEQIDKLFLRIMKVCGVGGFKRWLMYKAVAWFGGPAWRQNDESREKWRYAFLDR